MKNYADFTKTLWFFNNKTDTYLELFWSAFSHIRTRVTSNTDSFHAVANALANSKRFNCFLFSVS